MRDIQNVLSLPPFKKDVDDTVLARPHDAEPESEQHSKPMDNLNPGDVILGDIRLTDEQKKFMEEDGHHSNGSRTKRNVKAGGTWPDGQIPYVIDSQIIESSKMLIVETMQYISERSCINFLQYNANVESIVGHNDRVYFKSSTGCSSATGKSIYRDLHYVFLKEECTNYQSKDGVLPTIIALDPLEMPYLGNAVMPSFYDLKELNLAYYCPNSAADVGCDLVCVNDGYLFSPYDNNGGSNCSCGCKPQYTGTYCELANPDFVPRCIQRFTIDDGLTGTISSPNYPFNYDPDMICQYIITGPAESNISLQLTDFILQPGNQTCTNDYLDIFLADTALADTTICGSVAPSAFDSNSNEIRIVFKSDSTIQDKGFSLMYTIHIEPSCNVSFNSSVGGIPNYVSESLVNTHCTYEINVPEGQRVALTLQSFDVQNGYCSVSSIEVYLGDGTSTPIQFCDQCVPKEEIISATNMMKIIFAVQGSEDKTSFYATYRAVEKIAINSSNPDVEGSTCSHCQSTTDQDKGYIQSPRYPQAYRRRMCCQYEITAPPGLHVELNFARIFQIEEEDTISIDIGGSQPIRLILTGHNAPIGSYVSHAEKMSIRFESNESWFAGRGFRAFFRSVSLSIPQTYVFCYSDIS